MIKRKIVNELYVASAAPIIETYWNDRYESGRVLEYFLVKPIIEYSYLLGHVFNRKIVGYVEAITEQKICNTMYYYDDGILDDTVHYDAVTHSIALGNVDWQINSDNKAKDILKNNVIEQYLCQSKEEIIQKLNYVREYSRTYVKENNLECATLRRKI